MGACASLSAVAVCLAGAFAGVVVRAPSVFGREAVEAAFEEIVVCAGEGEVLLVSSC